jgi:hypothetical protein
VGDQRNHDALRARDLLLRPMKQPGVTANLQHPSRKTKS